MDFQKIAIQLLNKYSEEPINGTDLASESYSFEVEEIAESLIPKEYQAYLDNSEFIMTHVFTVKDLLVYFIEPTPFPEHNKIFVGLLKDDELMEYHILSGGTTNA